METDPIKDGGPAFPSDFVELPGSGFSKGMSLRDFFAAVALLGEYLRECSGQINACGPYSGRSEAAYRQADSMIARMEETKNLTSHPPGIRDRAV